MAYINRGPHRDGQFSLQFIHDILRSIDTVVVIWWRIDRFGVGFKLKKNLFPIQMFGSIFDQFSFVISL